MQTKAMTNTFIVNPIWKIAMATGTISGGGVERRKVVVGLVNIRTGFDIPIKRPSGTPTTIAAR